MVLGHGAAWFGPRLAASPWLRAALPSALWGLCCLALAPVVRLEEAPSLQIDSHACRGSPVLLQASFRTVQATSPQSQADVHSADEYLLQRNDSHSAGGSSSLFGQLAEVCSEAIDGTTQSIDNVAMGKYIDGSKVVLTAVGKFGSAASAAFSDMGTNLDGVKHYYRNCSMCSTLTTFLGRGKYRTELLWLLRSQEFLVTYIRNTLQGDATAATDAYEKTLYQHHSFVQAIAFRLALKLMPDKEELFSNAALAPGANGDKLHDVVERDAKRAVDIMLPMVSWMLGKF